MKYKIGFKKIKRKKKNLPKFPNIPKFKCCDPKIKKDFTSY